MAQYGVHLIFYNGEVLDDNVQFDTYRAAEEYGWEMASDYYLGGQILHMSNPGDYPLEDEDEDPFYLEVYEIEDED